MTREDKLSEDLRQSVSLPPANATAEEILEKHWHKGSSVKKAALKAMHEFAAQRQPQPTAEGSEDYLIENGITKETRNFDLMLELLEKFAALTADKKLREELIAYEEHEHFTTPKFAETTVDEYLKTRSHE